MDYIITISATVVHVFIYIYIIFETIYIFLNSQIFTVRDENVIIELINERIN